MQPKPLNVDEGKFVFFLVLRLVGEASLVLAVKPERRREEIVDLQRVDWMMDGAGFGLYGSISEMGWINWLLGLLHFMCSELSVTTGMVSTENKQRKEKRIQLYLGLVLKWRIEQWNVRKKRRGSELLVETWREYTK